MLCLSQLFPCSDSTAYLTTLRPLLYADNFFSTHLLLRALECLHLSIFLFRNSLAQHLGVTGPTVHCITHSGGSRPGRRKAQVHVGTLISPSPPAPGGAHGLLESSSLVGALIPGCQQCQVHSHALCRALSLPKPSANNFPAPTYGANQRKHLKSRIQ